MVLCLIALPIFAILGIFSLKYRALAKDSLECLFKTATLRKCESGLDDRIKAEITGRLLKYSQGAGAFFYRHYKIISFIILIIFLWSTYASGVGVYNYLQYGNCNGPASTGFCPLDPTGANSKITQSDIDVASNAECPSVSSQDPIVGNKNASLTMIEFGCYACPYTKKAEPVVKEVLDYYNGTVNLQFRPFEIPGHAIGTPAVLAAYCALEQGKYEGYHEGLFAAQESMSNETFYSLAENLSMNMTQFSSCMDNQTYKKYLEANTLAGIKAGVEGTPTFFVNNQKIVGPKPFKTFKTVIDAELKNLK